MKGISLLIILLCWQVLAIGQEKKDFSAITSALTVFDLSAKSDSTHLQDYTEFYSINLDNADHFIGTLPDHSSNNVVQVFVPSNSESLGTVILSHGYYDHAGVLKHLIQELVKSNYTVAVIDHLGHGLSPGEPAAIGDFKQYTQPLKHWIGFCNTHLPAPHHLIGHSMGCAIVSDLLLFEPDPLAVDKVILLAPLVRPKGWKLAGFGLKLGADRLESVPRKFTKNSSDETFLEFHRNDPLQAETVPMSWVLAHRKWYKRIHAGKPNNKPITIIQGDDDGTVDWKYNLEFLAKQFPKHKTIMIKKGEHQLLNDAPAIRKQTLSEITKALSN